jgi:agmatinase
MNFTALKSDTVAILGIPFDDYSSFERGAAMAPQFIRRAYHSNSSNLFSENGTDLGTTNNLKDLGDLKFETDGVPFKEIQKAVGTIVAAGARILSLGGDHSITFPIVRSLAATHPEITIVQFDAHPDLYDELDGNRYSHACPFARIMEEELAARLLQIGIRTMNSHQSEQAKRFGVEIVEMRDWDVNKIPQVNGPIYISFDMDVLDPAFAPGVSHPEAGGISTREVISIIQQLPGPIIGADIVEFNPGRDQSGITAVAGAKLMKELLVRLLE